ncbi:MAG TPA: biliverdin-producing heme oxygenase [Kofleriaceae bacterium]|nr:biliverdin-producing heme oxygenase [Kofleriaceae bacterium]
MLARLDQETRDQHAEVDVYWLDLMASGVTREQYRSLLVRLYGFEAPLESALAYTPHLVVADRRERTLSGLLAQDLLALGLSPSRITALPQCAEVGPFSDPAEALGWKYVIERPAQLHGAIKRNLVSRVADIANACSYLSAFDGIAPARWHQLGMLLDEVAQRPGAGDRMAESAHTAFATMSEWFRRGAVAQGAMA